MANPENYDFSVEDHISGEVGERVRAIISAAETAAGAIRHEAEDEAAGRRRLAESERERYLESARHEAHELLQKRVARIKELSDALIEGAERLLSRLDEANDTRRELDRAVGALSEVAASLADEGRSLRASQPAPVQEPQASEPEPAAVTPEPEPSAPAAVEQPAGVVESQEPAVDAEVVEEVDQPEERTTDEDDEIAAARHLREAQAPSESAGTNGSVERSGREDDDEALAARLVALQMAVAGSPRGEVEAHLRATFELDDMTSILNDVFGTDAPRLR